MSFVVVSVLFLVDTYNSFQAIVCVTYVGYTATFQSVPFIPCDWTGNFIITVVEQTRNMHSNRQSPFDVQPHEYHLIFNQ